MSSVAIVLVDAIKAALKEDPNVAALVAAKVFDEVPGDQRSGGNNASPPWIYVGPIQATRLDNDCDRMWSVTVRLFCASTGFGRREAWSIADAVDQVLDGLGGDVPLALAAGFGLSSPFRASNSGDVIGPLFAKTVFCDFTCTVARDGTDGV